MPEPSENLHWILGENKRLGNSQHPEKEQEMLRGVTKRLISELIRRCEGLEEIEGTVTLQPRPGALELAQQVETYRSCISFALNELMQAGLICTTVEKGLRIEINRLRRVEEMLR